MDKKEKKEKVDFIISFLDIKQHIFNICDIAEKDKYITTEDKNEVLKWKDKYITHVYEALICNLCDPDLFSAFKICPFCIYVAFTDSGDCTKCEYGKRHGICNKPDSEYQILICPVLVKNVTKVYSTIYASEEFLNLQRSAIKIADQLSLFNEILEETKNETN